MKVELDATFSGYIVSGTILLAQVEKPEAKRIAKVAVSMLPIDIFVEVDDDESSLDICYRTTNSSGFVELMKKAKLALDTYQAKYKVIEELNLMLKGLRRYKDAGAALQSMPS